jgi:hypothetical protein
MYNEIVYVDCRFADGRVITTDPFTNPGTLGAPPPPIPDEQYRQGAREWLSTMRHAVPPFDGITFTIRRTTVRA